MRRSALLLLFGAWAVGLVGPPPAAADTDVGSIAVIETNPTILQPGELFDLNNRSLTFTPRNGGGYTVSSGTLNFDSNTGTNLNLGDDASVQRSLAFTFPFFGVNRTSVFINSNGNLTFGSGSTLTHFNSGSVTSLGSDLSAILDRIAGGQARIAVLWQDWNPAAEGGVFANSLSDRFIVTWSGVPLFGTSTTATFQVILFSTGVIQMNYQNVTTTPGGGYLVGISPGSIDMTTTIDFSQGGSSISSVPNSEPLVQVFGSSSGPLVHIPAVARRFFNTHTDAFDQFVMFANFTHAMGNAFAFEQTTRQTVSGINLSLFNDSSFFGSSGQLQSFLNMNRLQLYPADPGTTFLGTNSTLDVMGQESGHMWLAFPKFDDSGVCSTLLLGRDLAHWSFFHDTDASDMEGNRWQDNGNGTLTTIDATSRLSALDQYIMGLRTATSVPTFFFIRNPTNTGGRTSSSPPETGVTVSGTRQNVTINQIQTCHGQRSPSSGFTAVNPTTTWKQAFILLIPGGTTAPSADTTKIDTIRSGWQSYFTTATGGRGSVDTTLANSVISVTPSSQNFGNVTVGSFADRNFTVQNTGGGTLTGTTSTSAPFSIISGASYSLGAGASQTVTVRFSPTSAATFAGNVTFTGGGGATRAVTGTGVVTATHTLTVASVNPSSGVGITVSPVDNGGLGSGAAPLSRVYDHNALVNLTAPATAGGNTFQKWQRDGVDVSTSTGVQVTVDANHTLTAVYVTAAHTLTITSGPSGSPNPVASGGTANLSVTAVDSLGHALSYQWSASCPTLPSNGSFSNANAQNPTWTAPANTTGTQQNCTVQVVVSDGQGLSQSQSYSQTVSSTTGVGPTNTFNDVPPDDLFFGFIEALSAAGITGGCATTPLQYCPNAGVTRDQMAVFLLRGIHGAGYQPPAATGTMFADVPVSQPFAKWIEQLAREGITGGCATSPPQYCPDATVTRGQMAVFLLRGIHGAGYQPPAATGTMFTDVPASQPFAKWIEQLAREGITGGCGATTYCPDDPVTRGQMAVFLVRAFNLPM